MIIKACINNHKDIAEWLYEISKIDDNKIDIYYFDNIIFKRVLEKGHMEMIDWLNNLS